MPQKFYRERNHGIAFQRDSLVFTLFHSQNRISCEHGANHRIHANIDAYHQYVGKAIVEGETFYVRFTVREDASGGSRNELHGTAVSNVRLYKAEDARLSNPSHAQGEGLASLKATDTGRSLLSRTQGESPVPFVDHKIALFLSVVNGGAKNDKNGLTGFVISPAARAVLDAGRELWRYYHAQPGANPNASYYDIRKHFQGVKTTASGKEQMNATSGDEGYNERLAALKAAMKTLAVKIQPKVYEYGFLRK